VSESLVSKNMNLLKLQRYQVANHSSKTRLGTSGWESLKYQGTLYDFKTPLEEMLGIYASQFDAVELHQTFSDSLSERRIWALKKEVEKVNPDFRFCPLLPRRISHEFPLGENPIELREFIETITLLGTHLGPVILRLPETLSPDKRRLLTKFFQLWPRNLRLALHVTGDEWLRKEEALVSLAGEIRGSLVSLLIEDRLGSELPIEKLITSDHLLIRFFGRPKAEQDEQRLALWVYRLSEYKALGVKNSCFFLYEEEEMCLSLLKKMANSLGGNVRVPQSFDLNSNQTSFQFLP
jgi:uncharacterized protein YecE (DUF72 family)